MAGTAAEGTESEYSHLRKVSDTAVSVVSDEGDALHFPARRRTALDKAMRTTIGADPYGHGSVEAKPGERDYREATIAGADAIVVHYVSTPDVLTVTAVKLITA
ncbi:hypothetical protein ACIP88_08175 [Streptomyces uncialis]|uniref:hypothetical protein n=1 Tax=Streptomyces uncialis TaxID=1048205 RepID=UPI003812C1C1